MDAANAEVCHLSAAIYYKLQKKAVEIFNGFFTQTKN
jgi:hypothetical protein